jgi:thioredoxin reductase
MPVAIIGAGPYGLAVAAYLRHAGVDAHVLGEPMESWRRYMPAGMLLRSRRRASHIAAPGLKLGIEAWASEMGVPLSEPMRVEDFVAYGLWYQQRAVPDVDRRRVSRLSLAPRGFLLELENGEELLAQRVVVGTGIVPFANWPEPFRGLPEDLVSHSSAHSHLGVFSGRRVLVLGAGQSALETAALLQEAGASPQVVARAAGFGWLPPHNRSGFGPALRRMVLPPTDVGGRVTGWLAATPGALGSFPTGVRSWVDRRCMAPVGADWLRERLTDVPLEASRTIDAVRADGEALQVGFREGGELTVDHLILCTGYRVDVSGYDFIDADLLAAVRHVNGAPHLGRGLESSVPGLHFAGAAAAASVGPITRFVVGTWYAAPAIATAISGRRQRPAHFAYRPRIGRGARALEGRNRRGDSP